MRGEKRPLFKKEAKEEALHPFGQSLNDDDDIGDFMVRMCMQACKWNRWKFSFKSSNGKMVREFISNSDTGVEHRTLDSESVLLRARFFQDVCSSQCCLFTYMAIKNLNPNLF